MTIKVVLVKTPKQMATELMQQGYRRTSRNHNMLARVDRKDWQVQMAKQHNPKDPKEGMKWVQCLGLGGSADYYRRVCTDDKLTVSEEVAKHVKSSCHDPVAFLPKFDEIDFV